MKVKTKGKRGAETSFLVDCQKGINNDIDNKNEETLQLQHVLQNIDNKGIATIITIFEKTKLSIVKVQAANNAKKEYDIQTKLGEGFIKFSCYFTCNNDTMYIKKYGFGKTSLPLCTEKGKEMGVILMPYYKLGSFQEYLKTSTKNWKTVQKLLVKTVEIVFNAFNDQGFTHGDLFTKNILLCTSVTPIVIDFENSVFNKSIPQFYRDIDDLIGDIGRHYPVLRPKLDKIADEHLTFNRAYSRQPTKSIIANFVKAISDLSDLSDHKCT